MANPLVSQLKVDNVTYDIKDSYLRDLLLTDVVDEKSTYIFRKTGGDKNSEIGDRNKEFINEIIGGSVVVNQLLDYENAFIASQQASYDSNTYRFTINLAENASGSNYVRFTNLPLVAGHKYFFSFKVVTISEGASFRCYFPFSSSPTTVRGNVNDRVFEYQSDYYNYLYVGKTSAITQAQSITFEVTLVDITRFLGSFSIANYVYNLEQTTTGAGVAWLYEYFPILNGGHIPYNTGKIESICISKHIMTKINQWNEKWEIGAISNGVDTPYNNGIRSVGYMKCLPSTEYYGTVGTGNGCFIWWYDINKNYISQTNFNNSKFTSPNNARYFRISGSSTYGKPYHDDICINISSDRNGEYEPFQEFIYPFDSSKELRGIFNIDANGKLYSEGDTCKSDGSGFRWYGYYDMGDMDWGSYTASYGKCYYGFPPSSKVAWKGLSDDYKQANVGYDSLNDREFTTASGTREAMFVRDDRYPTVESFAAAVKGKYVMYELASSVAIESTMAIPNPQSCDVYGTEEFVDAKVESGERAISIPVCCTTTYLAGINSDTSTLHVVDEDTETLYVFD